MCDLCSPMIILLDDEADAFWCFERLMRRLVSILSVDFILLLTFFNTLILLLIEKIGQRGLVFKFFLGLTLMFKICCFRNPFIVRLKTRWFTTFLGILRYFCYKILPISVLLFLAQLELSQICKMYFR